jgi:hypothetical protein
VTIEILYKRRGREIRNAVHLHKRLRAWEDGEKPSPTRDCKAGKFSALVTFFGEESQCDFQPGWEGRADASHSSVKFRRTRSEPPSQETGGVSIWKGSLP